MTQAPTRRVCAVALMLAGCASPARVVDTHIEAARAEAPPAPVLCVDPTQHTPLEPRDARRTLYVFVSPWCTSCDQLLAMLTEHRALLRTRRVRVITLVTATEGTCLHAARVATQAPFAYGHINQREQQRWAIRSTPTLWIVDPKTAQTRHYIEGLPTLEMLRRVL